MSDQSLLRNFKYLVIPAEIWLRKDLSMLAKGLWAEIHSLHNDERDGCFASDEYLIEFLGIQRRQLYNLLKELKEKGLVSSKSNGRGSIRKAICTSEVHIRSAKNCTSEVKKSAPPTYIENKALEESNISLSNSLLSKTTKIERLSFGSHVKLSKEEHEKLYQEHSKLLIDSIIQSMNDYCLAHGKSYKDYAAAIRQWLRKRTETPRQSHNAYQPDRRVKGKDNKPVINPYEGIF